MLKVARLLTGAPSIGFNVNDGEFLWTEMILQGKKTVETRNSPSLNAHVGEEIGIIRTGRGPATLVGYCTLGEPIVYKNNKEFRADHKRHQIPTDSSFDLQPGTVKYGYPISNVKPCKPVQVTSQGRVFRKLANQRGHMLKVSKLLTAMTLYHGNEMTRNFTGKYLILTPDPGYASYYNEGSTIDVFDLVIPPARLFSLRDPDSLFKLSKAVNNPDLMKQVMSASTTGELDWSMYDKLSSSSGDAEATFEALGFRGVWLGERSGIKSIILFYREDAKLTGKQPASPSKNQESL